MRFVLALTLWPLAAGAGPVAPDDLSRLPPADIVILGEVHDNPAHHANQARAVAALAPKALVLEMLTSDQAAAAVGVDRADRAALESALGWAGTGWPDFALYHPIFAAAPGAAVVGGALPRAEVRRAMAEGAAAVFGPGAEDFGLTGDLPPEDQARREADQQAAHCDALPPAMLPGFVAAQRLRDAVLARAALAALSDHGGPVAVIAGTGHARRDEGIPAALAAAAPGVRVLSVGQVEADPGPDAPFDLWVIADPAPRDDPCAAFAAPAGGG